MSVVKHVVPSFRLFGAPYALARCSRASEGPFARCFPAGAILTVGPGLAHSLLVHPLPICGASRHASNTRLEVITI